MNCKQIATLTGGKWDKINESCRRVYSPEYASPCLTTCGGGNQEVKIAECIGGIGEKKSNGGTQYYQQDRIYEGDIALAHPANLPSGSYMYKNDFRIRKLTPLECFRLMGFDDADFENAKLVNSDSQLYKQAGNSIVVNVLEAIIQELL